MPNPPHAALIFAAGFGTRMGALTRARPKPLIEVGGKPLLDHALDLTQAAGVADVVVNAHYKSQMIESHLSGRPDIHVSVEFPEVLETGGGLRKALPLLGDDPVFTLNSDAVWTGGNPLRTLCAAWDPDRMDALLLLIPPSRAMGHSGSGDFIADTNGRLERGPGAIYTGAQIIRPTGIADIRPAAFSLNLLWDRFLARGRLFGVLHKGGWCDVGRPEGIAEAEAMLKDPPDV